MKITINIDSKHLFNHPVGAQNKLEQIFSRVRNEVNRSMWTNDNNCASIGGQLVSNGKFDAEYHIEFLESESTNLLNSI